MRSIKLCTLTAMAVSGLVWAAPAQAGPYGYIGEVSQFGFNFCPREWMPAEGQLLPIQSNQALYSILGTTYGGDGRTTFALPDVRQPRSNKDKPNLPAPAIKGSSTSPAPTTCIRIQGMFPPRS